jgi:hypothetical protein
MKALLKALREGSASDVRELLLKDSRVVTSGGAWRPDGRHPDGGASLLREALESRRERDDKLRALLNAGADVNSTSLPKGSTLLNHALLVGDLSLARLFLSLGADVSKRDRRGLSPMSIAVLREDADARALLEQAGAHEAAAGPSEAEQAFLLERPLYAEIHETIKWAVRGAGLDLSSVRIPAPWGTENSVVYGIRDKGWRIRLGVSGSAGAWSISLTLEDEAGTPLADLLPGRESVTNSLLRGHLVTMLKGARAPGGFASRPAGAAGKEAGGMSAGGMGAFSILGISATATREEITRAYRRLAKVYHPDRAGADGETKMKEVNRAYEEVAKKRK